MTSDVIKRFLFMVLLVLVQVLVLNHIHLFNIAIPFLYIMLPLHFGSEQPKWSALLWCFCTGLLVDIFSNTPGIASGSMTLIGLVQPFVLMLFLPDDDDEFIPTLKSMGWLKYSTYVIILISIFCLAFFTLEAFSFFNPLLWIESIGASIVFSFILIMSLEKIRQ